MTRPLAHLDFETFSELPLKGPKGVGTSRYAEDPSTDVLCAAYAIGDEAPAVWTPDDPPPRRLFDHVAAGGLVHAWNVEMEIPVWREVCTERYCWPEVPFDQWRDTAAVALVHALPAALDNCGAALGLAIQKDPRGRHLVNKLCKPRRPSKHDPRTRWTPESVPKDFEDLYAYCARDVEAERAVHHALPHPELTPLELAIWRMTVDMNLRGWAVDIESVNLMIEMLAKQKARALAELVKVTGGAVRTENQIDRALEWLRGRGVSLPNYQALTIEEALRGLWGEVPPDARRVLEIRQELAKASVKKFDSMVRRVCRDGTVKNNILHHGAATGRDAGRGLQIQNFVRAAISKSQDAIQDAVNVLRYPDPLGTVELVYGSPTRFASLMTRPMMIARPGHDLLAADFSSIENRVIVWYAECPYGIDIFNRGLDEYVTFATHIYRDVEYDGVSGEQRQRAKPAVLGCCFGQGWEGLQRYAATFGQHLTDDEAKRIVKTYRTLYAEVPQLWYGLAGAAIEAVESGQPTRYKRIKFRVEGDFLYMILAGGRRLAYRKPRVEERETPWGEMRPTVTHMGTNSKTKKWERMKIIPGRFAENAVQATARDLLMRGALAAARAGYRPVGRVHDELVSEVPEGFGDLDDYCRLMAAPPSWLDGIPIEAVGWRGKRYRK